MSTAASAKLHLKLQSEKKLKTLLDVLKPETETTVTRRAKVKLEKAEGCLVLTVEADDAVALRSTLNAYLRWINSTLNILDALEQNNP